ncbi:MAG: hypothetical protein ACYCY7_12870 [Gallionella sp.]
MRSPSSVTGSTPRLYAIFTSTPLAENPTAAVKTRAAPRIVCFFTLMDN